MFEELEHAVVTTSAAAIRAIRITLSVHRATALRSFEKRTSRARKRGSLRIQRDDDYFSSAVAPASFKRTSALSASALLTFSSTGFGAASTRSFASFTPS